jgi:hypothetical protein
VLFLQDVGRQQPHTTFGSPLVPARMSRASRPFCTSFAGLLVRRPVQEARALVPCHRADGAGVAMYFDTRRTFSSRSSVSIASITASIAAQAIGPPPKVVPRSSMLQAPPVLAGVISSAAQGKPLPSALAVVIMSGITSYSSRRRAQPQRPTPICTSSKISSAPTSSQRLRSAARKSGAQVEGAADALHRLDHHGGGLSRHDAGDRGAVARGMKPTSNGVRGKPYHLPTAPQVTAPAAAVRPWKPCSMATTGCAAVIGTPS